jgi:hypothetical protein
MHIDYRRKGVRGIINLYGWSELERQSVTPNRKVFVLPLVDLHFIFTKFDY